jgi:CDP-glucose 4,6-dehydratase
MKTPESDFWRGRRVLVTGCTGLLGSWLCEALLARGAQLVGLVRDAVPRSLLVSSGAIERIVTVRGDVNNQELLERVLAEYEIQTVFHLAAQAIVGVARRNPVGTFDTNIGGTWAVLEAARRVDNGAQVLVASSDKAYGAHDELPYTEEMPLQGRHPYDASKSCADLLAQSYASTYGLPVGITRCGNLYGGGDLNWNRLVPGTMRAAIEGEPPLIRSDGQLTRDYLYVEDGAGAYMTLAEALAKRPELAGRAFNFGNDQPVSVLELVRAILQVANRTDLEPRILNEAQDEIPAQYLDSTRAHTELGWQPEYSLQDGLARTLEWYRKYLAA